MLLLCIVSAQRKNEKKREKFVQKGIINIFTLLRRLRINLNHNGTASICSHNSRRTWLRRKEKHAVVNKFLLL